MSDERFGNCRVTQTIGSGALSTSYKAVQEPSGRKVVVKALKTQIAPGSSFADQIEREGRILADLAHPNVVLLLDAARTSAGRPYLVLEQVDGPSVAELLTKKTRVSVETAIAIAIGICAALEHVHAQGVVHRDVKTSNILLSQSGTVKLIDFGIAQRARTAGLSESLGAEVIDREGRLAPETAKDAFGTPAYMSPEQILGDFVDGRSDLFSLGVVLYEMLSGALPFHGSKDDRGSAQRLRRDAPAPLRARVPHLSRPVERIVMRLLEKSPDDRYSDASAVRERLESLLRSLTRESAQNAVRAGLATAGFVKGVRPKDAALLHAKPPPGRVRRALLGQAAVLVLFVAGAVAIESRSATARAARAAGAEPLSLLPRDAGGLRVLATPWANVRIDGQDVETTPFARAIPLSAGVHWVILTHPNTTSVEREVTIAEGEIVTLDVTMPLERDGGTDAP